MRVIDDRRDGFTTRLNESLKKSGMGKAELSRLIGVDRSTVTAWSKGRRWPNLDTTRTLAATFKWPIDEVLFWFGVYEGAAQNQRQGLDNPSVSGDTATAGASPPVNPPQQTVGRPPEAEPLPVPSSVHRSLYLLLSDMSAEEIEEAVYPAVLDIRRRRKQPSSEATGRTKAGDSG